MMTARRFSSREGNASPEVRVDALPQAASACAVREAGRLSELFDSNDKDTHLPSDRAVRALCPMTTPADKRDSRGRHWPGCLLRRTVVMKGDWVHERDD